MLNRFSDLFYQFSDFLERMPIGFSFAILWGMLEPFMMFDYDILGWISFLFIFDTLIGTYKHARKGTASSEGFRKFFDKLVVICGTIVVIHVTISFEGAGSYFGEFFSTGGHFTLIAWLARSILWNLSEISGGNYPPKAWLDKFDSILQKKDK